MVQGGLNIPELSLPRDIESKLESEGFIKEVLDRVSCYSHVSPDKLHTKDIGPRNGLLSDIPIEGWSAGKQRPMIGITEKVYQIGVCPNHTLNYYLEIGVEHPITGTNGDFVKSLRDCRPHGAVTYGDLTRFASLQYDFDNDISRIRVSTRGMSYRSSLADLERKAGGKELIDLFLKTILCKLKDRA